MEASNRSVKDWFNRIRMGQIKLPRFQRHEAWGHNEVEGLLGTVVGGLPAGALLILEVGDAELFVSRYLKTAPQPGSRVNLPLSR
ncbi:hypothetical protein [Antrihabitans spumae]|uniref:DUF262 domain-containing protein n=1 Tax=Antrihabitans spumae TaxID=3373370 RepID=A0ABW7KTC9_9NOCA